MQTLTIELMDKSSLKALRELEHKHLIRIVKNSELSSYAFPGEPMNEQDFRKWIEHTENSPTLSVQEAKQRWETQKEKLQKHIQ